MHNLENPARLSGPGKRELATRDAHEAFARLTRLARRAVSAPAALIMLLDDDAAPRPGGGSVRQAGLAYGLCHCVVESGRPLVIVETRVHGDSDAVMAFAGVPLREPSGRTVGSFCMLDHRPRRWTDGELRFLGELGRAAETEIALRAATGRLGARAPGRDQTEAIHAEHEAREVLRANELP